jgi:hypothetical protein
LAEFTQLDEHLYRNLDLLQGQVSSLLDTLSRLEETDTAQGHKKRLFQLRKKKSAGVTLSNATTSSSSTKTTGSDRASPVMAVTSSSQDLDMDPTAAGGNLTGMASLSNSNQSLNTLASAAGGGSSGRPTSFPGGDVSTLRSVRGYPSDSGLGSSAGPSVSSSTKEEALQLAQDMQAELASMTMVYLRQRDQLKQMIDSESKTASLQPQVAVVASLRQSLNAALQQNAQLRTRLARIHAESDLGETPSLATTATAAAAAAGDYTGGSLMRGMNNSLSYSSSCISEFFDAREYADSAGDTDDDVSDTDFSDTAESGMDEEDEELFLEPAASSGAEQSGVEKAGSGGGTMVLTGRRRTLPVPKTDTEGVNLWNLLCKNIGELSEDYVICNFCTGTSIIGMKGQERVKHSEFGFALYRTACIVQYTVLYLVVNLDPSVKSKCGRPISAIIFMSASTGFMFFLPAKIVFFFVFFFFVTHLFTKKV